VLLNDVLDLLLLEVLELVLLHVEDHLGTATDRGVDGVGGDGEGSAGSRLPDVLLVVVVLGDDGNLVGDEVGRVETNTLKEKEKVNFACFDENGEKKRRRTNCPIMEMSAPEERASMKALVPDLAIVPRLLTRSALVTASRRRGQFRSLLPKRKDSYALPIPESRMVRVPLALSGVMRMKRSFSESSWLGSVRAE
jgi:hypothetical protein